MKSIRSTSLFFLLFTSTLCFNGLAQTNDQDKSTKDLSFLVGEWQVKRIYSPEDENKREMTGTLECREALDSQFIQCTYDMERPGKTRGLDVVYFNYNPIYQLYESVWLSSTWPIKGILQSSLEKGPHELTMNSKSQFKIENGLTEYVKGELRASINNKAVNSFTRKTYIRTSAYAEGLWHYHMIETVTRVK